MSEALLDSLKDNVIIPNVSNGHIVDIYSYVWDLDGETFTAYEDTKDPRLCSKHTNSNKYTCVKTDLLDKDKYLEILNNIGASNIYNSFENYLKEADSMLNFINKNKPWSDHNTISRHLWLRSVHYGIKGAFEMINNSETYDFIIRTRTGINYGNKILFSENGFNNLCVTDTPDITNPHINLVKQIVNQPGTDGCLFIPVREHDDNKYIDDHFSIGVPKSMKIYASFYYCAERLFDVLWYWPQFSFNNETALLFHLIENNVKIVTFPKLPLIQRLPLNTQERAYIKE